MECTEPFRNTAFLELGRSPRQYGMHVRKYSNIDSVMMSQSSPVWNALICLLVAYTYRRRRSPRQYGMHRLGKKYKLDGFHVAVLASMECTFLF